MGTTRTIAIQILSGLPGIHQDLSRRDFTVNAMAFNQAGLVDPFHGKEDLKNKVISAWETRTNVFQKMRCGF